MTVTMKGCAAGFVAYWVVGCIVWGCIVAMVACPGDRFTPNAALVGPILMWPAVVTEAALTGMETPRCR